MVFPAFTTTSARVIVRATAVYADGTKSRTPETFWVTVAAGASDAYRASRVEDTLERVRERGAKDRGRYRDKRPIDFEDVTVRLPGPEGTEDQGVVVADGLDKIKSLSKRFRDDPYEGRPYDKDEHDRRRDAYQREQAIRRREGGDITPEIRANRARRAETERELRRVNRQYPAQYPADTREMARSSTEMARRYAKLPSGFRRPRGQ